MKHRLLLGSGTVLALALAIVPGCSSDEGNETNTPTLMPAAGGSTSNSPGAAGSGTQTAAAGSSSAPPAAAAGSGGGSSETPPPVMMMMGAAGSTANAGNAMGGSAGAPAAGGAGGAPPAMFDPSMMCPAAAQTPSNGRPCTVTCTDDCGIQNVGTRLCTCTNAAFACASCDIPPGNPFYVPPTAAFPNCAAIDDDQEDDESGCTDFDRCQSLDAANRFCGCLDNSWDCDGKPNTFMF
jgi:hypothetical protein